MITKKITKEMEEKFLKIICRRYIEEYGYGTRNLDKYKVPLLAGAAFEDEMPEICEFDASINMRRYLTTDLFTELMARGFIECSTDNCYYWMTPSGYEHASKKWVGRFVSYLNNNSGLLALISLVTSIIAVIINFLVGNAMVNKH